MTPVSEARALEIYANKDLLSKIRASGVTVPDFDKPDAKKLCDVFNSRKVATIIAKETDMENVLLSTKGSIKTLTQKYGSQIKLNPKDFAGIFASSSVPYIMRNSPFLAAMYFGLKDKNASVAQSVGVASGLGALSSFPAAVGNAASLNAAKGYGLKEAMKQGVNSTARQVVREPQAFALAAISRIIANLAALAIFNDRVDEKMVSFLENALNSAFGVTEEVALSDADKAVIDKEIESVAQESVLQGCEEKPVLNKIVDELKEALGDYQERVEGRSKDHRPSESVDGSFIDEIIKNASEVFDDYKRRKESVPSPSVKPGEVQGDRDGVSRRR